MRDSVHPPSDNLDGLLIAKLCVPWPGPVPAPGASKVVMVWAVIWVNMPKPSRMIAAGTNWSLLFARWNGFIFVKATTGGKRAHSGK